jgi:hypothetical protein
MTPELPADVSCATCKLPSTIAICKLYLESSLAMAAPITPAPITITSNTRHSSIFIFNILTDTSLSHAPSTTLPPRDLVRSGGFFQARAKHSDLHHHGGSAAAKEKLPTDRGPKDCVKNGSPASLLVRHVSRSALKCRNCLVEVKEGIKAFKLRGRWRQSQSACQERSES